MAQNHHPHLPNAIRARMAQFSTFSGAVSRVQYPEEGRRQEKSPRHSEKGLYPISGGDHSEGFPLGFITTYFFFFFKILN